MYEFCMSFCGPAGEERDWEAAKLEKKRGRFLSIIILEIVAVVAVIAVLLVIKYFSGDLFGKLQEKHTRYFEDETRVNAQVNAVYYGEKKTDAQSNFVSNSFVQPLSGSITSGFGIRNDPFSGKKARHEGTDIAAAKGSEIIAAAGGTVSFVGYEEDGYGKYLKINHGNKVMTLYAHCSKILVSKGDTVTAGQTVALVGSTGQSTGNHLHFEIRIDGKAVNTMWYLNYNEN